MSESRTDVEEVGAELDTVIGAEFRGVVVDFWSPWCAPCRPLKRQLARIAGEHAQRWRFVAVNTESHPEVAVAHDVRALPTVVIFRRGEELHRFSGQVLPSAVEARMSALDGDN